MKLYLYLFALMMFVPGCHCQITINDANAQPVEKTIKEARVVSKYVYSCQTGFIELAYVKDGVDTYSIHEITMKKFAQYQVGQIYDIDIDSFNNVVTKDIVPLTMELQ